MSDPRHPDIWGIVQHGVVYTGGKGKIAEHGGADPEDRDVPILVYAPRAVTPGVLGQRLETTSMAPTIMRLLGLDPYALQAVQIQGTPGMPSSRRSHLANKPPLPPEREQARIMRRARAEEPIRRAGASDADAVARLLRDFNAEYDDPVPPQEEMADRIRALLGGGDTVILVAGEPACAVSVMRFRPGLWSPKLECYLAELYVVPGRRGQGIGRVLMEESMAVARAEGAGTMELGTGEDDVAARALYESLGFTNLEHSAGGVDTLSLFYERDL